MAKDPAFLFYSKDWLEGTGEMTPSEKGVYIDLLAHQHQKGSLPSEIIRLSKLAGLSQTEFLQIWEHLKVKFDVTDGNRLVNRKLTGIVTDRSSKSLTNRITGTLAAVIRKSDAPHETKEKIKKSFDLSEFLAVPTDSLTAHITEWYILRLKSIGNGIGNENVNTTENTNTQKTANDRSPEPVRIIPEMCSIWYETIPGYTQHKDMDYKAAGDILRFICEQHNVTNFLETESQIKILNTFQLVADQVGANSFWKLKPLKSIAGNIQEFYNKIKSPDNGKGKSKKSAATNGSTREQINDLLAKRYGES